MLTIVAGAQSLPADPSQRCGTVEHERILQQRNPNRLRQINDLNQRLEQAEAGRMLLRQGADEPVYRIPIVVHVVHSTRIWEVICSSDMFPLLMPPITPDAVL